MFDNKKIEQIAQKKSEWESSSLRKTLDKAPEAKPAFKTISGTTVERLYTPLDMKDSDYVRDLGFPGEFPYTRGIQPTMYRGRLWTMRQYAGYGTAEDTNKRYKFLLSQGQTGLSVAFDLPTQMGYDSDDARADGEVGRVGVAVCSLRDMETIFNGIPLGEANTSMTINSTTGIILAMYLAVAEKQGASPDKLSGTLQNDILKEYVARGTYIFPPGPSMRLVTDVIKYCTKKMPRWNPISICGYHMREAGCTATQEVAFTIADGMAYTEACTKAGLNIDDFAPRFSFFFSVHSDFFEEIAKFRAARNLWAKIVRDKYGAKDSRSMQLRFGVQTSGSSLVAQQPENNIIRATLEALASVLGGTQSLACACMDEALALPTEKAVRIALRTQQIIAHESGVTNTIDPFGGSYFVESLTSEIEEGAMKYIEQIEKAGNGNMLDGVVRCIEEGFFQKEIADASYRQQKEIENGQATVVGVNKFKTDEKVAIEIAKSNPKVQMKQIEKLRKLRSERDNKKVGAYLERVRRVADRGEDIMPVLLDAVQAYATVGEICNVLRGVFGEYKPQVIY